MSASWTVTRWNNELCEMVNALTLFHPLPVQCSQSILIESFQTKDYSLLLHSLREIHYKHLDLNALIHQYHDQISNCKTSNKYYPFKRYDTFNITTNIILFHPLVSVYELSSSPIDLIHVIALKNDQLLSEFVIANFIFQRNTFLLKLMFQRLSFLELNKSHCNCIYNKIKNAFATTAFTTHYQQNDLSECIRTLSIHIAQHLMTNSDAITDLLSAPGIASRSMHLIECVLDYNPWFIFERLIAVDALSGANYDLLAQCSNRNDMLFILAIATLTVQSAAPDVLTAHNISMFINKTYNSWNKILTLLRAKNNNEEEMFECHSLIIKALSRHLESSEYLSMFDKLQPSMNRINRNGTKYCTTIAAQMWIETTPASIYDLWKTGVESNAQCTRKVMQQMASVKPHQMSELNPLHLSQYPLATLCDLLSQCNGDPSVMKCADWYEMVHHCLVHHLKDSYYLSHVMDAFVYQILRLFRVCGIQKHAIHAFTSWNSSLSPMDTFSCRCKGVKACGCSRDIWTDRHSLSVILDPDILMNTAANDSIFPFLQRVLSMCCDIPSLLRILEFCSAYLGDKMNQINDENVLHTNKKEYDGFEALAQSTQTLFKQFFYDEALSIKRYVVCDKIFKLWGAYLSIQHEHSFEVLIRIQCHLFALEALSIFNIKNAPVLFNLLMEKTKQMRAQQPYNNDQYIADVLRDYAQTKFCKILMNLHGQWVANTANNMDNEDVSAYRIALIIEGLKHLIEMNHTTLNTQMFNHTELFFDSICKLESQWKSSYFDTEDIKHLLMILDLAHKNSKWTRCMNLIKQNKKKRADIHSLFATLFVVIKSEEDETQKREAAALFLKVKKKMM